MQFLSKNLPGSNKDKVYQKYFLAISFLILGLGIDLDITFYLNIDERYTITDFYQLPLNFYIKF